MRTTLATRALVGAAVLAAACVAGGLLIAPWLRDARASLALLALGSAYVGALITQHHASRTEPPVVWSWWPILGSAIAFGADTHGFLSRARSRHGGVFTLVIAGKRMSIIADRAAVATVVRLPKTTADFNTVAGDVMINAFGCTRACWDSALAHIDAEIHRLYIQHLQGRDALDALTVRAARALDSTLSPSRALGGEGREWSEHSLNGIVKRSVFAATVDAIFGASVATDEAYRAFTDFDAAFPLLVGGMPCRGKAREGRELLLGLFRRAGYEEGASEFVEARARVFRDAVVRGLDPEAEPTSQAPRHSPRYSPREPAERARRDIRRD